MAELIFARRLVRRICPGGRVGCLSLLTFLVAAFYPPNGLTGQSDSCTLTLSGRLTGDEDGRPLSFATVLLNDRERGAQADDEGRFRLEGLCPGEISLRFNHIGCSPKQVQLTLSGDTSLTVSLHHHDYVTETVVVSSSEQATYSRSLDARSTGQLGEALERLTGVSTLRTGTAAAKPMYDGLYGNRLSIQNNGVAHAGQRWGNDHAPEIDSWTAAYTHVVDGVAALRYGGSTLGPTVLIEPLPLTRSTVPGFRGQYAFQDNGRGHTLNARLSDTAWVAYRLSGSLKYQGDRRAPDYFLNNTGRREGNLSAQLARFFSSKLTGRLYYSLFASEIGVLRGAHVGNLTDLERAIGAERPFFTEEDFSYEIASPRQTVTHHLLKAEAEYRRSDRERYLLRYGGQLNLRDEYDVRRGDDDRPALSLMQWNHQVSGDYRRTTGRQSELNAGLRVTLVDNENRPGTGILPLLPDYEGERGAAFVTYRTERGPHRYRLGASYDYQHYRIAAISRDLPRRVLRSTRDFGALAAGAEAEFRTNRPLSAQLAINYRERPPEINELYSQGLHQGVSGIEEGDSTLGTERGVKAEGRLRYDAKGGGLSMGLSLFAQYVDGFINLEPTGENRLTIRGAFPVFQYRGVDARLLGVRFNTFATLRPNLFFDLRLALVRGDNLEEDRPLVFVPADNLRATLTYSGLAGLNLSAGTLAVRRQTRLEADQDFLAPPPGYVLFNLSASKEWKLDRGRAFDLSLDVDNLFDTAYRDYLDRQRYYTDAVGRVVTLRLGVEF